MGDARPTGRVRPTKPSGLALPGHEGAFIKRLAAWSRLVFKWMVLCGPDAVINTQLALGRKRAQPPVNRTMQVSGGDSIPFPAGGASPEEAAS